MKKNNTKRVKTLMYTIMGLTLVSGISIGLSTWVLGLQQDSDTADVTVEVDAATNQTRYLEIAVGPDNTISIMDDNTSNAVGDGIGFEANAGSPSEIDLLQVKLSTFDVVLSTSDLQNYNQVEFTWGVVTPPVEEGQDTVAKPEYEGPATSALGRTNKAKYTYIELATATLSLTEANNFSADSSSVTGYTIYTATDAAKTIKFVWGSLFQDASISGDNLSPIDYYQTKFDNAPSTTLKLKMIEEAKVELDAMRSAFMTNSEQTWTGKTIRITASLSKSA